MTQRPPRIFYKAGYKYQLQEDYSHDIGIFGRSGGNRFVFLTKTGLMLIRAGYASDGASGPMPDIQTVMRAAFVHDAASQLLELGVLLEEHRKAVDALLRSVSIDAGMWPPLAALVHNSVDTFGGLYRANRHDVILSAP